MLEAAMRRIRFIEISMKNGRLVITLAPKSKLTLKQLLARVNEQNLYHEIDTGLAIGNETW
jgi:antitoxin component of MazEF toxin-antitoxin module